MKPPVNTPLSPERVRELIGNQPLRGRLPKMRLSRQHGSKMGAVQEMCRRGCSAIQISKELNIPRSTVYRMMP